MKFKWLIAAILIVALLGIGCYFTLRNVPDPDVPVTSLENGVKITDEAEINSLVADSFLDILIQIKSFDEINVNSKEILEAAMRIARECNLIKDTSNNMYIEYVEEDDLHNIIYELTGIEVTEPISFEDFYYMYDSENKYYYVVPTGIDWIHFKDIKNVEKSQSQNIYQITCSANFVFESEEFLYEDFIVTLKYVPNNTYVKYQLLSIEQSNN